MEGADERFVDQHVVVLAELQHIAHGVATTSERQLGFRVGVQGLLAFDRCGHIVEAGVVALDAVGSLNGPRQGQPS
jgi:hypothetical protein